MKLFQFILTLGIASAFNGTAQAFTLISDLDDTIKHTHVGNTRETVENALFSKVPFGGMADLYDLMANRLYIVSGSPKQIRFLIEDFLEEAEFVWTKLYLRNNLWDNIENFKLQTITHLILQSREPVILIGDDTEKDPEIFLNLKNQYPNKVAAAYIRRVKGRTLPKETIGFYHPFEIAGHEWSHRRLSENNVIQLGRQMEAEFSSVPHYYFPQHVICPTAKKQLQLNAIWYSRSAVLRRLAESIANRTTKYCLR